MPVKPGLFVLWDKIVLMGADKRIRSWTPSDRQTDSGQRMEGGALTAGVGSRDGENSSIYKDWKTTCMLKQRGKYATFLEGS